MGKHQRRSSVFFDETGRRTRLATTAVRSATVALLGTVAAVIVTLVSGVPLPGVTPPVQLPSNERPLRHAEHQPSPTRAVPLGPVVPVVPVVPVSTIPQAQPTLSSTPPTTSPPAPSPSPGPPGLPRTPPGSTRTNNSKPTPTSTTSASRHGPPATPPGHTKHP